VTQSYREAPDSQARRRDGWRRTMTPAFAGLVGGAFISTDALPAPPEALFYAVVGGKPGIFAPGAARAAR
jgi:hypothetical protein